MFDGLKRKEKIRQKGGGGRENEYMRLYELIRHQQIQTHKILEITAKTQHQAIKEQNRRNYRSAIPCTDEKKIEYDSASHAVREFDIGMITNQ